MNSIFYYYQYENKSNYQSQYSICSIITPSKTLETKDTQFNWTNETFSQGGYENIIIGYFVLNDEDFLVAFPPQPVIITSPSHKTLWIIIIFVLIVLIIIYSTYVLYQQIKMKQIEVNSKHGINITLFDNSNKSQ